MAKWKFWEKDVEEIEEGERPATAETVRQKAMDKLDAFFDGLSPDDEEFTKKAEGVASFYKEVMGDDQSRKSSKWDTFAKILKGVGSVGAIGASLWMFGKSTEKEEDEIYDTATKRTVVQNGLSGKFFDHFRK